MAAPLRPQRRRFPWVLILAAIALAAGAYVLLRPVDTIGSVSPAPGQAIQKCHAAVTDRLKSPGSAKFGALAFTRESDTRGRVTGWVDAQNGFGALTRTRFACFSYLGGSGWWVQDVTFTEW